MCGAMFGHTVVWLIMLIWTYLNSILSKRSPNLQPSGHDYLEPQRLAAIQETHMAQSRIVAIDAQDSEAPEGSNDTMVEGFIYRDSTADFPCEIVTVGYMGGQPPDPRLVC